LVEQVGVGFPVRLDDLNVLLTDDRPELRCDALELDLRLMNAVDGIGDAAAI